MKKKVYVLMHGEGEYGDYQTVIDGLVLGPEAAYMPALTAEYWKFRNDLAASEKATWKALPRASRKNFRHSNPGPFIDWLVAHKGFKRVDFEEYLT